MGWLTVGLAALQFAGSMAASRSRANAASDSNALAKKQAKIQFKREMEIWEINTLQGKSDYAAKVAEVAALRYVDRIKKADYELNQSTNLESALQNLRLNMDSLNQTYVVEEAYRARQVSQDLIFDLGTQSLSAQNDIDTLTNQSLQVRNDAITANIQSMQAAAQYLNNVKVKGMEADAIVATQDAKGQEVQEAILIGESLDTIRRDAKMLSAIVADSGLMAKSIARQGGSKSGKRLGIQGMQAMGRTYGELQMLQKDRRRNLSNYNQDLVGRTSSQLALISQQMKGEADKIKFSSVNNAAKQKGYELAQMGFGKQMQYSQGKFVLGTRNSLKNFVDLTIPSFGLAQATGDRNAEALIRSTMATLKVGSTPYREAIIFDPYEPIAGLKPEYSEPTMMTVPGMQSSLIDGFMAAADTAASMSYTDSSGNLAFR